MEENHGISLYVGVTVARETLSQLQPHFVREIDCGLYQQNGANCLSAALINAVLAVRGSNSAVKLRSFLNEEVPHLSSVNGNSELFSSARMGMEAQWVFKLTGRDIWKSCSSIWRTRRVACISCTCSKSELSMKSSSLMLGLG